jgi:hypothetical protein
LRKLDWGSLYLDQWNEWNVEWAIGNLFHDPLRNRTGKQNEPKTSFFKFFFFASTAHAPHALDSSIDILQVCMYIYCFLGYRYLGTGAKDLMWVSR